MQTIYTLLIWKWKLWTASLLDRNRDVLIRNGSTAIVLILLLYTAYRFFHDFIFKYVAGLEEIGFLLIDRLVSTGFLAFFILLVLSSFIAAIAVMFRSDETEYLLSTPVSDLDLFTSRFVDIVVYSSWAVMAMAIPLLFAYARIRGFGFLEYVLAGFFVLLPFILIAAALGTILALVAVFLSWRIGPRKLIPAGIAVFAGFVYAFVFLSRPSELQIPFHEDFRSLNLFINNFHLNSHPFTPNYWLVQSLQSLANHRIGDFFLYASALISTAGFVCALLYALGWKVFLTAWLISSEESAIKGVSGASRRRGAFTFAPAGKQAGALLMKDTLLFLRNPSQWAQFLLIFLLMIVYFINLRFVPTDIEVEHWRTIIALLNFGFIGFILATMAVRFIYPSISMEGNSFWVIGSAPLPVKALFREKFWSSFITFFLISEPIAVFAGLMLHLDGFYLAVTIGGILVMSMALSCLAVGFGAAFPSFTEADPSRIASSPGGILTIVVSLAYVGIMTMLVAIPLYRYTVHLVSGGGFPIASVAVCFALALMLNFGLILFSFRLGASFLARREF
jgi:ABC-2 type transport system permease protein